MRRILATAALLALAPAARASALPFSPGEQMDLAVEWLRIPTGRARLSVGRADGAVWTIVLQGQTEGVAKIVDVREHLVSYFDVETRLPRGSDLTAVEVGDRHQDRTRFDRATGRATVTILRKGKLREEVREVPAGVHDLVTAFFWLRWQALRDRDHYELPVFASTKVLTLTADVVGRETLETRAGSFRTVKVQVRTAFEGQFRSKRDTFIWFSDDERRVLVRISAEFVLGSVVASLTAYRPGETLAQR
ncbi:MAG TPA: DUF3108 domain-containing protein [Anaeromyxobacteraceae bacterium]|jgi:hypothetical protein